MNIRWYTNKEVEYSIQLVEYPEATTKEQYVLNIDSKQPLKVLNTNDWHFKSKNPNNRVNYLQEQVEVLDNLIDVTNVLNIDILIINGDIYDGDFTGNDSDKNNMKIVSRLTTIKEMGVLILINMGNHDKHAFTRFNRSNFFYITKLYSNTIKHELEKARYELPKHNLFVGYAFDKVRINNTMFHMKHFSDVDKEYLIHPSELIKGTNVGFFHDAILPSQAREHYLRTIQKDISKYSSVKFKNDMFAGLDYAFIADIHTRIGEMQTQTSTSICCVDIQGSMMRTQAGLAQAHDYLNLPILEITDKFVKSSYKFNLRNYDNSFRKDIIEETQQKNVSLKLLEDILNSNTATKSFDKDIQNLPEFMQSIVNEIRTSKTYKFKTLERIGYYDRNE